MSRHAHIGVCPAIAQLQEPWSGTLTPSDRFRTGLRILVRRMAAHLGERTRVVFVAGTRDQAALLDGRNVRLKRPARLAARRSLPGTVNLPGLELGGQSA